MFLVSDAPPPATLSLMGFEAAFTAILVGLSFVWPRVISGIFVWLSKRFTRMARSYRASVVVVGLSALLLRIAILPILPVPIPLRPDEFSNLLAADTFLHGRLTNPTPPNWVHFETIHVDMLPTYTTMYFPGQGLVLAAGELLFGQPWFGVMIGGALMCAAVCWMLQAWLPPSWALLGGLLAVMRIGLFSYWTSTYDNAGPLSAIGGALVLGSLPRFRRGVHTRHLLMMSAGAVILGLTRPYEGFLLCFPVGIYLLYWILTARRAPIRTLLIRAMPAVALLIAGIGWLGYYDYRAFGSPLTLPYTINRNTYATAPYYVWEEPRPEPHYRHAEMKRFYKIDELDEYFRTHSPSGLIKMTVIKFFIGIYFFTGFTLIPPLFMLPLALRDRRIRFLVICLVVLAAGMTIEVYLFPHYLAPFTAAFYALGLQSMRHLYHWKPGGQPVGMAMSRGVVSICVLMAFMRLFDKQLNCPVPEWPVSTWLCNWIGPDHFVTQRSVVASKLKHIPGGQLAIVRYSPDHDPLDEWVFNGADIDGSKVIWARDMDDADNRELFSYYKDRKIWLIQPDVPSAEIVAYPVSRQVTAALTR